MLDGSQKLTAACKYIYTYVLVCVSVCIYIYIYIYSVLSASNVKTHVRHDFFILVYPCGCKHNLLES